MYANVTWPAPCTPPMAGRDPECCCSADPKAGCTKRCRTARRARYAVLALATTGCPAYPAGCKIYRWSTSATRLYAGVDVPERHRPPALVAVGPALGVGCP